MNKRFFNLLAATAAILPATASASRASDQPQSIKVALGDGTVDATRLKPYDNAFVTHIIRADGRVIEPGIWTDQLRLREVNGRKVWVRTQSAGNYTGTVYMSINTFDPVTFAPIATIINNPNGSKERWTYTPTSADGHLTAPDGKESEQHLALAKPAYDFNCCMRSIMGAALPLAIGKTFILPGIVNGDELVALRVAAREKVKAGYLGMVDAWRVENTAPGGEGTITFWIADKPPYLVRMTLAGIPATKLPDGVHYDQSFDMIDER